MIKDNQKYFNRLQVVLDGLMIILSYLLAWFLMLRSVEGKEIGVLPPEFYMMVLVVLVPFFLLLYYACNLYTPKRVQGRRLEGSNIVKANIIGGLTLMAAYFFLQLPNVSRLQIGLFLLLNVIFLFVERNVVRIILMRFRKSGLNLKHIVLVGYSRAAEEYIDRIVQNPQWGYKVMGILDDRVVAGTEYRGIGVLGTIGSLSFWRSIIRTRSRLHLACQSITSWNASSRCAKRQGCTRNLFRITARSFRQSHIRRICSVLRSSTSVTFRFPTRLI